MERKKTFFGQEFKLTPREVELVRGSNALGPIYDRLGNPSDGKLWVMDLSLNAFYAGFLAEELPELVRNAPAKIK